MGGGDVLRSVLPPAARRRRVMSALCHTGGRGSPHRTLTSTNQQLSHKYKYKYRHKYKYKYKYKQKNVSLMSYGGQGVTSSYTVCFKRDHVCTAPCTVIGPRGMTGFMPWGIKYLLSSDRPAFSASDSPAFRASLSTHRALKCSSTHLCRRGGYSKHSHKYKYQPPIVTQIIKIQIKHKYK